MPLLRKTSGEPDSKWRPFSAWDPHTQIGTTLHIDPTRSAENPSSSSCQTFPSSKRPRTRPNKQTSQRRRLKGSVRGHQQSVHLGSTEGKGKGVFSDLAFSAGETILRERPFIKFRDPLTSLEIYTALGALSPEDRDIFWSFSGRGSHTPGDVDIAETNLIPLEDEECGMFAMICRVNHCCSPNARWAWSSREGKMVLIALSDIAIGKEITVSSLDSVDLLAPDRQEMIQSSFNFECLCRICALDPADLAKSNSRRAEIKDTFDKWDTVPIDEWSTSGSNLRENKLRTLKQMDHLATILEKEPLPIFTPRLLEYQFQVHAAWGEYKEAQRVGKEWEVIEKRVSEAPGRMIVSEGIKMIRKDPRKWGEWGKLRKLDACRGATRPVKLPQDQSSKGEGPPRNLGLKCAGQSDGTPSSLTPV